MARSARTILPRRIFLRGILAGGISVAVPLPRLCGMLNDNGTAYADGSALPVRFGSWFFGNGIIPDRWVPTSTGSGSNWALSEQLAPLQDVKPWLSVLTGFTIKIPNSAAHASMPAAALTGAQVGNKNVQLPTIDQVIAKQIAGASLFPTGLHVGISNDLNSTALGSSISFSGPAAPNSAQLSPAALYKQLLQFANTSSTPKPPDPDLLRRSQVLDAVSEATRALRTRLGSDDQMRLDSHLEGLRQLQLQVTALETPKKTGTIVDPDMAYPNRGADGAITRQRGQAFSDLLVFAMASDLTRVFSYAFSWPACEAGYPDCGLGNTAFHEDFGHRLSAKGAAYATLGFNIGVKFAMSNLADTLGRMRDTPDGAGNLLDNSCVYATSCVSESQSHGGTDYPLLVAGKAGGKLKGDQHIRILNENVSKVPFTLLTALGGTATSFGLAEGSVNGGVPDLLAT